MSQSFLTYALSVTQSMLGLSMILVTWRILIGPRAQDRVLALDSLYVTAMLMLVVFGIQTGRTLYFEAALVISLVGFTSTLALAKFLMRGEVIE